MLNIAENHGTWLKTPFKTLFSAHIEPYPFNILYIYKNVLFIACISSL